MDAFWTATSISSHSGAAHGAAQDVSKTLKSQNVEINRIHRRVDRLALACQAMWELLRDSTDIEDKDIFDKMEEVDLRDGVRDEKMGAPVVHCPSCGRKGNAYRPLCIYCGAKPERPIKPAFD